MKSLIPFLFFVILPIIASATFIAHNGTITGIVKDENSQEELVGAHILLKGTDQMTITNELGFFEFSGLRKDTYTIVISYIGYQTIEMADVKVNDNKTTPLRILLEPASIHLPQITIQPDQEKNTSTMTAMDIALRNNNSSQDLLQMVPGLFIAQHAGGGKAEQIFLRGFDIDHGTDIHLSVDGLPVNMVSHAHGQGYSDLHFLIPELVKTIDFSKGPYRADIGNFATAGGVQFHTLNAPANSSIGLEAGQFDTYRLLGIYNLLPKNSEKHKAYVAGTYQFSNGYFDSPQHFNRINLFAKYTAQPKTNQRISFSFSIFDSQWDASGQIPQRAVDQGSISRFGAIDDTEGGYTGRKNFNLQLTQFLNNNAIIKNQFYYTLYDFELYSNFTFFARDPIRGDQIRQKEARHLYGYNGSYQKYDILFGKLLRSELGLQIRFDQIKNNELSYTANRRETLRQVQLGDVDEINVSLYTSSTLLISEQLNMTLGLRFDQFLFNYTDQLQSSYTTQSISKNTWSPKFKLNYQFSPFINLYTGAGISFHSNDTRVVLQHTSENILPKAIGSEIGLTIKPVPAMLLDIAAWWLDLEQELVYVGDEGIVEPSGRTRRVGIDLSVRYQLLRYLFADADINLANPRLRDEPEGDNVTFHWHLSHYECGRVESTAAFRFGRKPALPLQSMIARLMKRIL